MRHRLASALAVLALWMSTTYVIAAPVLRLHPPSEQQLDIGALSAILQKEAGIRLLSDASIAPGDDPLASLLDGSADLAVVENTRLFQEGLRAVLNLYTAAVHLSARQTLAGEDLSELDRPLRVEILHDSPTGKVIADLLAERSADLRAGIERWRDGSPGEPDLQFYVGPINPRNTRWFREGFALVSLERLDRAGAEFYLEGVRFLVPQLKRTRIPALTYTLPGNDRGIDVLAVDMLLVSHRRVDPKQIYALTRALVELKPRFAAAAPELFRWLNPSFEGIDLAFPLHEGTRRYLERDEPGFLERYAETLNFLVYLTALLVTGLVALGRWRSRRRKDRIDGFYLGALELRARVGRDDDEAIRAALDRLERDAFAALVAERLAADDSFRIFTELVEAVRDEISRVRGSSRPPVQ